MRKRTHLSELALKAVWVYGYAFITAVFVCLQWIEAVRSRRRQQLARLACITLIIAGVMGSSACARDPHVKSERYLAKAEQYLKEKKYDEAMIEARRAVQLDSKSAKAHYTLAMLLNLRGNTRGAYQETLVALLYNPDYEDAHALAADLMVHAGDFKSASEKAKFVLDKWPSNRIASLVYVESQLALGEAASAQQRLQQLLLANPKDARAQFDEGLLNLHSKEWDAAEGALRKAWELEPDSLSPALVISNSYQSRGDPARAESVLKEAVGKHSDNVSAHYLLCMFYMRQSRLAEAETEAKQIQQIGGKKNPQLRQVVGQFYLLTSRISDAEKEFKRLVDEDRKNYDAARMLARVYLIEKRRDEARKVVDDILQNDAKDAETLVLRASMAMDVNKPSDAIMDLQTAQKANPDTVGIGYLLARAYLAQQQESAAQAALADALRRDPNFAAARMLLAELEMRHGQVDQALQDLQKVLEQKPKDLTPYLLMSQAQSLKGDFTGAAQGLNEIASKATNDAAQAVVLRALGYIRLNQKKYREAENAARKSLTLDPKSAESLRLLGLLFIMQKQNVKAVQELSDFANKYPDWAAGQTVVGEVALQVRNFGATEQAYRRALQIEPGNVVALKGLANLYLAKHQTTEAIEIFEQIGQKQPDDPDLRVQLGQLYEANGDLAKAQSYYESAIKSNSQLVPVAKNNLAYLYAEHGGNIDVALKLAEEAKEALPQDPHISDTLAWIYIKKGRNDAAVQLLKASLEKMPDNPGIRYHMGVALFNLGQYTEARMELQAALKSTDALISANARKMLMSFSPH